MSDRKNELRELCRVGRFPEALLLSKTLCKKMPRDPELWFMAGAVHGALGAFDQAEKCCRKALELAPEQPVLLHNLGIALLRQQKATEAEQVLRRARALQPANAEIVTALADSVFGQGRLEQAISLYTESLAVVPSQLQALMNLATAQQRLGHFGAAEASYRQAVCVQPRLAGIYLAWSKGLIDRGEFAQALVIIEQGLTQLPAQADLCYQQGFICSELGRHEQALSSFNACLASAPEHSEARFARASIMRNTGRLSAAAKDLQQLLAANEGNARVHGSLSSLFLDEGRIVEALQHDRRALELEPDNLEMQQHSLLNLHYAEQHVATELFAAHHDWGQRFGVMAEVRKRHANERAPERVLRIAYVSSDFRQHSVAHFIAPILQHHKRSQYLVYCYSNLRPERHDVMTSQLRAAADLWRDVAVLSDAELARLIAADGIDILVDLSGHTSGNRLGMFAYRPAPLQMTWIGYPDTTGLPAMDYRLTDAWADPVGAADQYATEMLLRIDDGFLCYTPPQQAPECGPPAYVSNGYITFGSLNNLAKMNDAVVASWSAILRSVPASRLLLKGAALADANVRERVAGRFAQHGIDASRLELIVFTASIEQHLACYQRMDIALDTFPYNGTTTSCEALWMGVPVVTMVGQTHAHRVGLSLLTQLGLTQFAAADRKEYEARAISLAQDETSIAALRATLRERMRAAPLMDEIGFCQRLEKCYRQAWRSWCEQR